MDRQPYPTRYLPELPLFDSVPSRAIGLDDRRAWLEDLVANSDFVFPVRRLALDGLEAWKRVVEPGYQGYVAKEEASAYQGGPTRRWLKVKQKGWTIEEDRWRRRMFDEKRR